MGEWIWQHTFEVYAAAYLAAAVVVAFCVLMSGADQDG